MGKQEKRLQRNTGGLKSRMVENLGLPKDLMLGASVLHMTGRSEVYVENYKGIMEYTSEKVCVKTTDGCIAIEGRRLVIDYYSMDEMKISGCISNIAYC